MEKSHFSIFHDIFLISMNRLKPHCNNFLPSSPIPLMSSMPFRRTDIRERFAAALKIAGMPTAKPAEAAVSA